jgi:hypothetical protein
MCRLERPPGKLRRLFSPPWATAEDLTEHARQFCQRLADIRAELARQGQLQLLDRLPGAPTPPARLAVRLLRELD